MKKLVLMLAVVFSASLFACGNKNAVETEAVCDTLTNDTIAADTTVAVAVAE